MNTEEPKDAQRMRAVLRILSLIGKMSGLVVAGSDPSATGWGLWIYICADLLKDSTNRLGDWLDNKKLDDSFKP